MDSRVLEYFVVTAEEGNITRAAERLLMTQPTLSRQLKGLEEELGVALFKRSNHRIYLTKEGQLFQARAQDILTMMARSKEELQERKELSGRLVLASGDLQAMAELSRYLADFQALHPAVKIDLHSGDNDEIKLGLDQGRYDFGILLEPVDLNKYEIFRMKIKETWGALVPETSDLHKKDSLKPGDLIGQPLLTISDRTVQKDLIAWSGAFAKGMDNQGRYSNPFQASLFAKQFGGAVIGLELPYRIDGMRFIPFEPSLTSSSVLAWSSSRRPSDLMTAFIDYCRNRKK